MPTDLKTLIRPRKDQLAILDHPARFKVMNCGRRFGKTYQGIFWTCDRIARNPPGEYWWVAPTYDLTMRGVNAALEIFPKGLYQYKETKRTFKIGPKIKLVFKSADNPDDSLLGSGLRGIVIDERAMLKEGIWDKNLRATLSDYRSPAIMLTTPRPKGEYKQLCSDIISGDKGPDWKFFEAPSWDNYILYPGGYDYDSNTGDPEMVEIRNGTPKEVFDQEYAARFIDGDGTVFRNVDEAFRKQDNCAWCGQANLMGLDIAEHVDYMAMTMLCPYCGKAHNLDRWHKVGWDAAEVRVIESYNFWKCVACVPDGTGVGDPFVYGLKAKGLYISGPGPKREAGYKFSNKSKIELIQTLMLGFERGELAIDPEMKNATILKAELKSYEYTYSASGMLSYNAPSGKHDDMVISLALAWWGFKERNRWKLDIADPYPEENQEPVPADLNAVIPLEDDFPAW